MDKTSISNRMKDNYEKRSRTYLTRRTPVIIRLDGKAFHTFTRGFDRPFDETLNKWMRATTIKLCENVQGCKMGYTQSDEISLLLTDYDTFETDGWFDYQTQKIVSVSASIATAEFNKQIYTDKGPDFKPALFDSRCFNIPKEEVVNYFIWRWQDWKRNSIQMMGQSLYSQKQLHKKNTGQIITMCEEEHGVLWGEYPDKWKNGNLCTKSEEGWSFHEDIRDFPLLREYIEKSLLLID